MVARNDKLHEERAAPVAAIGGCRPLQPARTARRGGGNVFFGCVIPAVSRCNSSIQWNGYLIRTYEQLLQFCVLVWRVRFASVTFIFSVLLSYCLEADDVLHFVSCTSTKHLYIFSFVISVVV